MSNQESEPSPREPRAADGAENDATQSDERLASAIRELQAQLTEDVLNLRARLLSLEQQVEAMRREEGGGRESQPRPKRARRAAKAAGGSQRRGRRRPPPEG